MFSLVDAENIFNSLDGEVALCNILHSCPSLNRILVNTYCECIACLLEVKPIYSLEGTTQGDPLAMDMYALGVSPFIQQMGVVNSTKQIWYADDCTVCGRGCFSGGKL